MQHNPPFRPPRPVVLPMRVDPTGCAGPTRGAAYGPRWRRTSSGCFVPTSVDADLPEQRIAEVVPLIPPGGAVTGWANLLLRGVAFLDGRGARGAPRPVAVVVGPGRARRRREGVAFLEDRLDRVEWVHGVPCVPARRALFDEMRRHDDLVEAVVAMDMTAAARVMSIERMRTFGAGMAGWDGVPQFRRALDLADEASASPPEVRYRMVWQLRAGLPRPLVNRPVFDAATWRLLGYPDLFDEEAGMGGEYDGDDHRRARRHSSDVDREALFRGHLIEVTRATAPDMSCPDLLVRRIHQARGRALFLPPHQRRWTLEPPPWWVFETPLDVSLDARGEPP